MTRFDDELIRHAILRELNRGGQIYFVHNRVHDIELVASKLQRIVPEARIAIGHGQMPEGELEKVMLDFVEHRFDLLLATTIVESGLDIPNANTIFIDEADRYGLADLHQLRGRVGRYKHRAYCYLLVDPHKHLSQRRGQAAAGDRRVQRHGRRLRHRHARPGTARRRQYSGHAAKRPHRHGGLRVVLRAVGTSRPQLKKLPPKNTIDVDIDLPGEAYIPPELCARHAAEDRSVSPARPGGDSRQSSTICAASWSIALAPWPPEVEHLLTLAQLRIWAHTGRSARSIWKTVMRCLATRNAPRIEQLAGAAADGCGSSTSRPPICRLGKDVTPAQAILAPSNRCCRSMKAPPIIRPAPPGRRGMTVWPSVLLAILASARHALLSSSVPLYRELISREAIACEWQDQGLLLVFSTLAAFRKHGETVAMLSQHFSHRQRRMKEAKSRSLNQP